MAKTKNPIRTEPLRNTKNDEKEEIIEAKDATTQTLTASTETPVGILAESVTMPEAPQPPRPFAMRMNPDSPQEDPQLFLIFQELES